MLVTDKVRYSRFQKWIDLREKIETSLDPLNDTSNFFFSKPRLKFYTDPYDQDSWPTPWELIDENEYCDFNVILGICYTFQLTERFKDCQPMINVALDKVNKAVYYLLFINDKVYGYVENNWIDVDLLPKTLKMQKIYLMDPLH